MVKISVDEAYAFDYLSILELKYKKGNEVSEVIKTIKKDLITSIGENTFLEVINSDEYMNLLQANLLTFDAVDKAKTDSVTASYVDTCNYQRMICKQKLQEKFFKTKISEVKIGYEKLKIKNE